MLGSSSSHAPCVHERCPVGNAEPQQPRRLPCAHYGCGIDGSQQRADTPEIPNVSPQLASEWDEGKVCMMNATTNAIGEGLVLGKMPWELGRARGYANGIIQEGCGNSNATVTNLRAVAERSKEHAAS